MPLGAAPGHLVAELRDRGVGLHLLEQAIDPPP
jgi:hypothetical protein